MAGVARVAAGVASIPALARGIALRLLRAGGLLPCGLLLRGALPRLSRSTLLRGPLLSGALCGCALLCGTGLGGALIRLP